MPSNQAVNNFGYSLAIPVLTTTLVAYLMICTVFGSMLLPLALMLWPLTAPSARRSPMWIILFFTIWLTIGFAIWTIYDSVRA
jgi:hypothetical protein